MEVEVYSVDAETLARIDNLEGHPQWYRRDSISITLDSAVGTSRGSIKAAVYMVDAGYDNGVYHASF